MARVSCQTNPNKECGRERVGHVIQERAIKGSIITGEAIMYELHPRKPRVPEWRCGRSDSVIGQYKGVVITERLMSSWRSEQPDQEFFVTADANPKAHLQDNIFEKPQVEHNKI